MSRGSPQLSSFATPAERGGEAFGAFDVVRVRRAVPDCGLKGGEEGTIVEILEPAGPTYLVDFSGGSSDPAEPDLPVHALGAEQLVLVSRFRQPLRQGRRAGDAEG
jgi:hypothetical protein